jgi:hypothetical protein
MIKSPFIIYLHKQAKEVIKFNKTTNKGEAMNKKQERQEAY